MSGWSVNNFLGISTGPLTPFFARENAMLAMGPWAGSESRKDKWMTVRMFLTVACPFVCPFAVAFVVVFELP